MSEESPDEEPVDSGDPFEELADVESDVDPFEELDEPPRDGDAGTPEPSDTPTDPEPSGASGDGPGGSAVGEADSGSDVDPLGEMETADLDEEDFFEEMETADLDEEAVWESVFEGSEKPEVAAPDAETADGADAVVRKEQYCKKCEHFSEPPELACNNPDTEIVELVGVEEFRVRNCPVVADRRRADAVFPDEG